MGGKALLSLGIDVRRMNLDEYEAAREKSVAKLLSEHPGALARVPPSVRDKSDFGDVDIVFSSKTGFSETFSFDSVDKRCVGQGEMRSYPLFSDGSFRQVDVFICEEEKFSFLCDFLSWNDLGTLLARIASGLGVSLSSKGLSKIIRGPNDERDEIVLSLDYSEVLEFLGLSSRRYLNGFDSRADVFDFVRSSPFFHSEFFLAENLKPKTARGLLSRPVYADFLSTLTAETSALPPRFNDEDLNKAFPFFEKKRTAILASFEKEAFRRRRFSGENAIAATGFSGRELGRLLAETKASFENEDAMDDFLASASDDDIRERFIFVAKNSPPLLEPRLSPKR